MPKLLKLAAAQSCTLSTTAQTLRALESTARTAAAQHVDILLFPEAYLGGYPRTCSFGSAVGSRSAHGRDQFLRYFQSAIDLGDTPAGAGHAWVERTLPIAPGAQHRGDGTRETLERIARTTGVFLVTGVVERAGGSLYCAVLFVDPLRGTLGKRRKVLPTATERLIWAQGSPSTLQAVVAVVRGVRVVMGCAICWENYMPLLRQSLYAQNVGLFLAPTADARETWAPLMQTVGCEGRCFVVSANQCVRRGGLPGWITGKEEEGEGDGVDRASASRVESETERSSRRRSSVVVKTEDGHEINLPVSLSPGGTRESAAAVVVEEEDDPLNKTVALANGTTTTTMTTANSDDNGFVSRGGSCIVSPSGELLQGPLWEVEEGGLLVVEADLEDCERGRLDLDVAGSYSRNDAFQLSVTGLDLNPPP